MTRRYAARTQVSPAQSRTDIEHELAAFGATQFGYAWDHGRAVIAFVIHGWHVRMTLPMPDPGDRAFTHTPSGQRRSSGSRQAEYEQAVRQRWRVMLLAIKAKLAAVNEGVLTVEEEFLSHVVLPDNRTVGQWMKPQLERAYADHEMPALMPGSDSR